MDSNLWLYHISGQVIHGAKRGKRLGFPTANLILKEAIPDGIYASRVIHKGVIYLAATFVGASGTFGETKKFIECYILDFSTTIYGEHLDVYLYKYLRSNNIFPDLKALINQIQNDVLQTRRFFRYIEDSKA